MSALRLLVVSDMAFETVWASGGRGPWVTQHEAMCAAFAEAGYALPPIVYWNVATKALAKGESFRLPPLGRASQLQLELASDSSSILCGACLCYAADGSHVTTVHFNDRRGLDGAVTHSGDQVLAGKSNHRITVALAKLPANVDRLFFSLCACGPSNLSAFASPYIALCDGATSGNFCRYALADAGTAPSALMAALVRGAGGAWSVVALGEQAKTKCCCNYGEMQRMCAARLHELARAGSGELALPVSAETAGVELLSGFSAGMLRELIAPEPPALAGAAAAAAAVTPAAKLRAALRGPRYRAVREAVAEVGEGLLAGYAVPEEEVVVPAARCVACEEAKEGEEEEMVLVEAVTEA